MPEAWIQLQCPECQEGWEANPSELPAPGNRYTCDHCGAQRSISEFMRTGRGLEILEEFHEA